MYLGDRKYNNLNQLKELKQARNKELLVQEVARMSKQINQRFYRLEKKGIGLNETAYSYAQSETGKEKPRYTTSVNKLSQLSFNELYNLALNINVKIASGTSSIKGIKQIGKKRITKATEKLKESLNLDDDEFNEEDLEEFIELGGSDLLNNKYMDSNQVIEDFIELSKQGNISVKEFIREFKRFKKVNKKTPDRVRKNWLRLSNRKRNKKRNKKRGR